MVVISNARIPVSKFTHIPSGINCDITCNNIIGVQNSKLLYSLQRLDDRIRPFLYVLKFWAKCYRLVGAAESSLSSYALNLLAVYYLQQLQPPILPSIESLQNEMPEDERVYCNGWNVSFKIPFANKTETNSYANIISLLNGFFTFYRHFNAEEMIICPLIGKALLKTEFCDSFKAIQDKSKKNCLGNQDYTKSSLKVSKLSVQDPFELNFNVTLNFREFELFQSLCEKAEKVCLSFFEVEKDGHQSLLPLFNKPLKTRVPSNVLQSPTESIVLTFKPTDIAMGDDHRNLCNSVGQFIGKLFSYAYDIVVTESPGILCKKLKVNLEHLDNDLNYLFKWRLNYVLDVPFNVCHKKRDTLSEDIVCKTAQSLLDHEKAITSSLSSQYAPSTVNVPKKPFALLEFSMNCDVSVPIVSLNFRNMNVHNSVFRELIAGFRRCIVKSVKQYLVVSEFLYDVS